MTASITKYSDLTKDDENLSKVQCLSDTAIYDKADQAIESYDKKILELATVKDAKIAPEVVEKAQKRATKRTETKVETLKPMKESLKQSISQIEALVVEQKNQAKEIAKENAKAISEEMDKYVNAEIPQTNIQKETEMPKQIIEDAQVKEPEQKVEKKSAKEIKEEIADTEAAIKAAEAPKRKLDIGG